MSFIVLVEYLLCVFNKQVFSKNDKASPDKLLEKPLIGDEKGADQLIPRQEAPRNVNAGGKVLQPEAIKLPILSPEVASSKAELTAIREERQERSLESLKSILSIMDRLIRVLPFLHMHSLNHFQPVLSILVSILLSILISFLFHQI